MDQWTRYRSEYLWHWGRFRTYSDRSQNRPPDVPQYLDKCWGVYTMMDRRVKVRSASVDWAISATDPLHLYRSTTRFIKSGSKCNFRCPGDLISCWEDTHPLRSLKTGPSPYGEGFFFLFYLLSFKKIVFHFLTKVDGHVSRVNRDKYPVHPWIWIYYLLRISEEHEWPHKRE